MNADQARALRAPFPPEQIGKLPRKGVPQGLDYVGHAAVTDRLLEVDPEWSWEPVAFAEDGSPLIVWRGHDAVLWGRLTICGVTRLGVGIVNAGAFELEKQLVSDMLRNCAMRFGVALDLWSRESLHVDLPDPDPVDRRQIKAVKARIEQLDESDVVAFTAWKNDQSFPWPWPVDACVAMLRELDRYGTDDTAGPPAAGVVVAGAGSDAARASEPPAYEPGEEPF